MAHIVTAISVINCVPIIYQSCMGPRPRDNCGKEASALVQSNLGDLPVNDMGPRNAAELLCESLTPIPIKRPPKIRRVRNSSLSSSSSSVGKSIEKLGECR